MDTAAKTGTTQSNRDKWLCGFTPNYTAATWNGYDTETTIPSGARSNANTIWKNVMTEIHKDLKKATFKKPDDIISVGVCKDSGLRATEICKNDQRESRVYSDYFVKGTAPSKSCTCHVEAEICTLSGKTANEFCITKEKKVFITKEEKAYEKAGDAEYMLPEDVCDQCKQDSVLPVITLNGSSSITLKVGEAYSEQGATAKDDIDGDITSKIITTGTVDNSKVGTYTITYTVSDSAGNVATATRTINIEEASAPVTPPSEPAAPTDPNAPTNAVQ